MSKLHPVIAMTGSSGAGTTFVKRTFEGIFRREQIKAAIIEGDSFHSVTRNQFKQRSKEEPNFSHFGPGANDFHALEALFKAYGESGSGKKRYYLHNDQEAQEHTERLAAKGITTTAGSGEFTPWEELEADTDILFYEGLHGLVLDTSATQKYGGYNVAQYVDLGIGVVPSVNLEWIQKIHRDHAERGYSAEATVDTILRRMPDYINHITPQFSRTDINFQRVPTVDTSNPFIARDIPTQDESLVVIRFRDPKKFNTDFPYLLAMIHDSFMSRRNSIVVPGGKMTLAMELILNPIIHDMLEARSQ
ncbi:phosphoribulokinase [Thiothrix eikelboomii]|uniref:Phosphoribulokinase n=1 Tax=Thiothrix eikelboomii TaxID=92487 RepID=A0A1T4X7C0_9GAMM|nr:phosphoribulokinase [Thiothrix eikelboomii]SKA85008.1 phosphoribulokinase [Thiothrix eikelboomii]